MLAPMSKYTRTGGFGIDVEMEHVLTFAAAAKHVGKLKGSKAIAFQTLHRWATRGCSGVVLETIFVGGSRCTSTEALQRFFAAVTEARERAAGVTEPPPSSMEARDPVGDVDEILRRSGIVDELGGAS